MLGIFKKFWGKSEESNVVTVPPPSPFAKPAAPPARTAQAAPARPAINARPPTPPPAVSVSAKASPLPVPSIPGSVTVMLGSIEQSLPEPLRHKIANALQELVPVPLNKVLPQLHRGSVSVTVKELRECAPELLVSLQGFDDIPVTLPLADVVKQIDPKLLPRRGSQKRIEVPKEVSEIFTQTSDGLTVLAKAPAQTPSATPVRAHTAGTSTIPAPVAAAPVAPAAPVAIPVEPTKPEKISLSPQALAALAAAAPKKAAPAKSAPVAVPTPVAAGATAAPGLPKLPTAGTTAPKAAVPAAASLPKPVVPAAARPSKADDRLALDLHKLAPSLPPEICKELGDVDVNLSSIALPMADVESMLKSGKVLFTWADLTNWLTPPLPRPPSNSAASLLIELPLKVIAPVFMAHHRAASSQKRAETGEGIPDLFQNAAGTAESAEVAPAAVAQTAAAPAKSAAPAKAPVAAAAVAPAKKSAKASPTAVEPAQPTYPSADALLGTSAGRFSPKEVIQNVAKLHGITGALLAMSDGLPVASSMPKGMNADTMAAFLPQMFGRMTQYTKELGVGALHSITLTTEAGAWQIFKQPNIYFAVCGKPGEQMPFNLLAQVAAELSKQSM